MSDSLERLHKAIIAAKDLDPALSRTAKLFQRGPAKMAKKLAEEAIEVVIDAVNGNHRAVINESADLLYNLSVLWVAAGVTPQNVWDEMDRRERDQGIAEKLRKIRTPKPPSAKVATARAKTRRKTPAVRHGSRRLIAAHPVRPIKKRS